MYEICVLAICLKERGAKMDSELLAKQILDTFDKINAENVFSKLRLSLKGENLMIAMLADVGGESTPGKLIEKLDFTAARLSAITKSLENKGLVKRIQNEQDKRSTIIALTQQGMANYMNLRQEIVKNALIIIEQLGERDVQEFLRIIGRLVNIANKTA